MRDVSAKDVLIWMCVLMVLAGILVVGVLLAYGYIHDFQYGDGSEPFALWAFGAALIIGGIVVLMFATAE